MALTVSMAQQTSFQGGSSIVLLILCLCVQGVQVREAGLRAELEAQATEIPRQRVQLRQYEGEVPGEARKVRWMSVGGDDIHNMV